MFEIVRNSGFLNDASLSDASPIGLVTFLPGPEKPRDSLQLTKCFLEFPPEVKKRETVIPQQLLSFQSKPIGSILFLKCLNMLLLNRPHGGPFALTILCSMFLPAYMSLRIGIGIGKSSPSCSARFHL